MQVQTTLYHQLQRAPLWKHHHALSITRVYSALNKYGRAFCKNYSLRDVERSSPQMIRRASRLTPAVRLAREASSGDLSANLPSLVSLKDVTYAVRFASSSELSQAEKALIFHLVDINMRDMAEGSSLGWDAAKRKRELFHGLSRYILVYRSPTENAESISATDLVADNLVGYAMFRFDVELGENMIYCYELQLSPSVRRSGIGRFLVDTLVQIAKKYDMVCLKLTSLKVNTSAMSFYNAMGFKVDSTSPDYVDPLDPLSVPEASDYQILRKDV